MIETEGVQYCTGKLNDPVALACRYRGKLVPKGAPAVGAPAVSVSVPNHPAHTLVSGTNVPR
jgi:hypothetical protein